MTAKDKQGYMVLGGVLAVVVAVLAVRMAVDRRPKPDVDNCVDPVTANTVIVIDHTEHVADQTMAEIASRAMNWVRDNVAVNERVSVFTVSDLVRKSLKPVLSRCRPREEGDRLTENQRKIRKRFHETFQKPLLDVLKVAPGDTRESPIAQALTDISLSHYLRGKSNTLLIFSDLLENTAPFSMYRCTSATNPVKAYRETRRGAQERPSFQNTRIVVNLVPRFGQPVETLRCRDQFWPWFFGDNEGEQASVTFDYLPGGRLAGGKSE